MTRYARRSARAVWQQRKQYALNRLEHDTDAWVTTPSSSPTSRNLQTSGKLRLGIGPTRDLVLGEGTAQALAATEIPDEVGDALAVKSGFDTCLLTTTYLYLRIHPRRFQAWCEADELEDRELMRGGRCLIR